MKGGVMTKAGKMLLVFGLIAVIAAITLYATINNETYSKSGKVNYKKPQSEKIKGQGEVSSAKVTTRGGKSNRYVTVRRITTSTAKEGFPSWSPDGQWIVFQSEDPSSAPPNFQSWGIYKIKQDGTGLAPVALPDSLIYPWMCFNRPSWSPDGAKIAYNAYEDTTHGGWTHSAIFIIDPDGSSREMVSHDTSNCYGRGVPEWSPNSKKIVCKHGKYDHLIVIDIDAGTEIDMQVLYPGPESLIVGVENQWPKFSPDGSKILFKPDVDFSPDPYYEDKICVIDTSGTNFVCVDTINNVRKGADWSPDGSQIVYSGDRGEGSYSDIYIVNADGTGRHTILSDGSNCLQEVDWQPISSVAFGRWIVYAPTYDGDDDNKTIWVVSTDGLYSGCLCPDTTINYWHVLPTWSPQGDKIVFASDWYSEDNYDLFVIDLDTDDNDFDLLLNWEEFAGYGTDPEDRDTDRGDENDGSEIANDRNPLNPADDVGAAPPYTDGHNPAPGDTGVAQNVNIVVHIKDDGAGVDTNTIVMTVEGAAVTPDITGPVHDVTLTYDPPSWFVVGQVVDVTIDASDRALTPHAMPTDAYSFTITTVGIEELKPEVPVEFGLFQNEPNPAHRVTTIRYQIPRATWVTLRIYDASGRLVKNLINESKASGYYSMNWDLKDNAGKMVSSGVYYYELKTEDYKSSKKMVIE
jgi:Tol biopolymer transport system component